MALLPLDVLSGQCLRTGDWSRPAVGLVGVGTAWGLVHFFTTAGPGGGRIQQRPEPDRKKAHHPVEIPHWMNPCNLDGFPGVSLACPHYARRKTQLYSEGSYEVSELANGLRVLRVNGEVFSSYDTHNGRLGDEYARMTVNMAADWRRVTVGGERPVRVLLLGLGGGAMVSGLRHKCHGRSTFRHRRASAGVQGCVITAVEVDERVVGIARGLFLGVNEADQDMKGHESVKIVVADAADYVQNVVGP